MKAALVEAPGQPVVLCDDVEIEEPRAGQVRVKVAHCGLCHSDLSIVDGAFPSPVPVVVGHEAAGVVDALGPHVEGPRAGRSRGADAVSALRQLLLVRSRRGEPLRQRPGHRDQHLSRRQRRGCRAGASASTAA